MAPNPRRIDAKLQELYDRVPEIPDCVGECHESCGPIEMSVRERERIRERTGYLIPRVDELRNGGFGRLASNLAAGMKPQEAVKGCLDCPLLTADKLCSVYEIRPMICRLWGASEAMPCPHGCHPVPRPLTRTETLDLVVESMLVGGEHEPFYTAFTPERRAQVYDIAENATHLTVQDLREEIERRDAGGR